jgi:transglutaminase-like putative cysteine protease
VRIDGFDGQDLFIHGGRQNLKGSILTVRKETLENLSDRFYRLPPSSDGKTYLEATPFIQSNDPVIKAQVRAILLPRDTAPVKAEKLVSWVYKNIRKRPVLSLPSAVETLKNLMGDCNEHAVLLAALARAAEIPADVEAGIVYQNGRFYYHAWNVLYLGSWITADATLGQMPADVTHIRFVRGTERQGDIIGLIGKIRLKILEQKK